MEGIDRYFRAATKYIYVTPKVNIISEIVRGNSEESQLLRTQISEKFGENMVKALSADSRFKFCDITVLVCIIFMFMLGDKINNGA